VFRVLSTEALAAWEQVQAKPFYQRGIADGRIVGTERLAASAEPPIPDRARWTAVLRHARIPFVSYPYEWCFGMLRAAARLQLDLLAAALGEDAGMKDASSYNVQWVGTQPVFIDVGSFEPLAPGAPWIGYRQFCELYLYPLLLQAYRGIPFQPWLRGRVDGITAAQARAMLSGRDLLRPGVLAHVALQARAQRRWDVAATDVPRELGRAGFSKAMILANVRRLRRLLGRLAWEPDESVWSGYATSHSYSEAGSRMKEEFVASVAGERPRELVWDLGANTGVFSRLVAPHARCVVAMDGDHAAIEHLYRALEPSGQRTIVPLVVDLADPSPGLGWRGAERRPLAARGQPDLVLALALLHHLVLARNVPLAEAAGWLLDLGGELVVEFVHRDDPMIAVLLRNKTDPCADYDREAFERLLRERAEIVRHATVPGDTRTLYHVRPRA
jgi:hypothetical protein